MQEYYANLFRYVFWANRRTLEALRTAPQALAQSLPLMAHILAAEHIWLSRLRQIPAKHPVWPPLTLDQRVSLADENAAAYEAFLASLDAAALASEIQYCNTAGVEFRTAVGDILTHVATHGAYHRGQIAKAIGHNGGTSVNTDFITFVRER